jgi:hypothetical protein
MRERKFKVGETVTVSTQCDSMIFGLIGEVIAITPHHYIVKLDDGEIVSTRSKLMAHYDRAWGEEDENEMDMG